MFKKKGNVALAPSHLVSGADRKRYIFLLQHADLACLAHACIKWHDNAFIRDARRI